VIAGGEGWHHGHTFNQVGGALAIGHGVTVLPYRTREAAYATAYALLVTQPEATGRPAPPVFLLLGEATHHYRRDDQVVVAAVDDTLEPPLRARSIELFEMFADRLTPVDDQVPTGVTRDGLRMALMQLEIDPDSAGERRLMLADRPPELDISEGPWGPGGAMCLLPDRPRRIVLPQLGTGPRQIVLVAAPGTAAHNHRWMIEIDGERRTVAMPSASPRARDTLGPLTTRRAPQVIALTGSPKPTREAACPHGGLFELRVLDPSRSRSVAPEVSATTFAPPRDLGHAVTPTVWVSGRGLSRYRAGIEPEPDVRGVSLRLHTGAPLQFAPELLPDAGAPVDLIVTLTQTRLDPAARLLVALDDTVVAELDPPDEHAGTWQSKPLRIEPDTPVGRFSLALRGASEGNEAWVRDIGLFSRQRGVRSALEPSQ
jgi:hypothetical protein